MALSKCDTCLEEVPSDEVCEAVSGGWLCDLCWAKIEIEGDREEAKNAASPRPKQGSDSFRHLMEYDGTCPHRDRKALSHREDKLRAAFKSFLGICPSSALLRRIVDAQVKESLDSASQAPEPDVE